MNIIFFFLMSAELAHNTTIIGRGFVLSINALVLLCFGFEGLVWGVQIPIYHPVKFCKVTLCRSALCDSVGTGSPPRRGIVGRRWAVEQVKCSVYFICSKLSLFLLLF